METFVIRPGRSLVISFAFASILGGLATAADPPTVRVLFFRDGSPRDLAPVAAAPNGMKIYAPAELPLILSEPAAAKVGGKIFVLDGEGLYRLGDLAAKTTANCILDRGDLWRLAGHLCRLQVHGWRHDKDNLAQWTDRARRGRLSISCGNVVQFVAHHLASRGHRARPVSVVTLEAHNGYDDGHVLTEVFDPAEKRWLLFDPDMKCRFRRDGRWLDLGETVELYRRGGRAELTFLAPPAIDAYADEGAAGESAQYSLLFEPTFRDRDARQRWYRRMFQVPVVGGKAGTWQTDDAARIRALGYGEPLSWAEWNKTAYGH